MSKKTKFLILLSIIVLALIFSCLIYSAYKYDNARTTEMAPYGYVDSTLIDEIYKDSLPYINQSSSNDYNLRLNITFAIRDNLRDFNLNDYNSYKFYVNEKPFTKADKAGTGFSISLSKMTGNPNVDEYAHIEFIKTKKLISL